jgi:hypothetical protein
MFDYIEMFYNTKRRKPNIRNRVEQHIEDAVVAYVIEQ